MSVVLITKISHDHFLSFDIGGFGHRMGRELKARVSKERVWVNFDKKSGIRCAN